MSSLDTAEALKTDTGLGTDPQWWRQGVVYQIYPRSLADADGIGDLRGITSRMGYLQDLGVDAVRLSPFYPSVLADGGYDADDHRDVDLTMGTLGGFDRMIAALHGAGIRLIVDIVPNHTSDRHEWFREALRSPEGSAARARYNFPRRRRRGRSAAALGLDVHVLRACVDPDHRTRRVPGRRRARTVQGPAGPPAQPG